MEYYSVFNNKYSQLITKVVQVNLIRLVLFFIRINVQNAKLRVKVGTNLAIFQKYCVARILENNADGK